MRVIGSGRASGARVVSSEELDVLHGLKPGFLERKTGMRKRFMVDDESQLIMGLEAIREALLDADCGACDIDMIISASAVPYQPIPNLSSLYAKSLDLGGKSIETLDVNSTCLSFVSALSVADALLKTGARNKILIVSSEIASRGLPWETDPETAAIFGDGAAAVVVEQGAGRVLSYGFQTYPEGWEACQLRSGGTAIKLGDPGFQEGALFRMNGKELFRLTRKHFPAFLGDLVKRSGLQKSDIDVVIPHQASPMALKNITKHLGFSDGAVIDIVANTGNQISASIPFTLDYARKSGRLQGAKHIALLGTSAGVSFGGMILEID